MLLRTFLAPITLQYDGDVWRIMEAIDFLSHGSLVGFLCQWENVVMFYSSLVGKYKLLMAS